MAVDMEVVKARAGKIMRRSLWILLAVLLVGGTGYYFWRTYPVSDGTRIGLLFKISKKGYVFKTYEGQLHLGASELMTEQSIWNFSVKDAATYQKMQQMEGKMVKCHYRELVNSFIWQGETNYLVYDAQLVE